MRNFLIPVVNLIAVGHKHELLTVKRRVILRYGSFVQDDVVEKIGSGCTGHAQPSNLNRRRPHSCNVHTMVMGESDQINQNVYFVILDALGGIGMAERSNFDKTIAFPLDLFSKFTMVVLAERIAAYDEIIPAVMTKHTGQKMTAGMIFKIV